jgi:hypothetical protein
MVLAAEVYSSCMLGSQYLLLSFGNILPRKFLIYFIKCLNQILDPAQGSGLDD